RQRRGGGLARLRVAPLRRQQSVGVQPKVGERRVDERLRELPWQQVDQQRLEERTGGYRFTQGHRIGVEQLDRLLHPLLAVVDYRQHTVELVQRGPQLHLVFGDKSLQLLG